MNVRMCGLILLFVSLVFVSETFAQSWRSVDDSEGCTWARVIVVNQSEVDSNWSLSGCRTAVASGADTATVDAEFDWDGVVEAGTSEYVWIYGSGIGEINIANADGDASAFLGAETLDAIGGGELTIVIAADGTSSVSVEEASAYTAPIVVGE